MSRTWKFFLGAIVIAIGLVAARTVFRHEKIATARASADDDATPIAVTVVSATQANVPIYATALGTITAYQTVNVNPQIAGQLTRLDFQEGRLLQKGKIIAEIDGRTLAASFAQAAAARRQNEALLATARSNYQRMNDPAYRKFVAHNELETQHNQVRQYEAAVAANAAQMASAQIQLQYTRITAPITGIAGMRNVDVGNIVNTTTTLVTLTQIAPIYAVFNLPESLLSAVRRAQAAGPVAVAALDRGDAQPIDENGHLDVINNQINSDSGTFSARAVFANRHQALWPGQFVNVRVLLQTMPKSVVIPAQAVQRGPDGDYVYRVKADQTVEMVAVKQGVTVGATQVQILSGLLPSERIVTEGQFRLKPHSRVTPLAPGQTPDLTPPDRSHRQPHSGRKAL